MDKAGRVVIPQSVRRRLGLVERHGVEIVEGDGAVEIRPAATPMRLVDTEDGPVAVPDEPLPPLTDDLVRRTLEQTRR